MGVLHETVRRLERLRFLDPLAKPLAGLVGKAVRPRPVRNLLSGTNLGHPLHPMLTDVPIGAWTMAVLLDATGRRDLERAADLLVGVGIVGAVPTAASGLNDWSDTMGPSSRIGLLHATANTTALTLYTASLVARCNKRRAQGRVLGAAGWAVLGVSAYLGGHLSYSRAVNVNHAASYELPPEWTPVLDDAELLEGQLHRAEADDVPVVLYRSAGRVYALVGVCSHAGGPLDEGTVEDGCVRCPWHGSEFRLSDGHIVRGPASTQQPAAETRVRDGRIEIRARA